MKQFLALLLSSFLVVITAGYGLSVRAQSSSPVAERFTPTPIAIAFNPATDGETYRPPDREQSDLPFSDDSRAIIGRDQRVPVLNRSFPWSAIGRIDWAVDGEEIGQCTGTLIGPDLVLTNSHCLAPEEANYQPIIPRGTEQNGRIQIRFKPSLIEGVSTRTATVIDYDYGWKSASPSNSPNMADDWALLKLDQRLGDIYGYLGWRILDFTQPNVMSQLDNQLRLAGYSGEFPTEQYRQFGAENETAGVHVGCSIQEVGQGIQLHNCDSMGGASGSALIALFDDGNYYIVGLHRGSVSSDEPNRFPPAYQEVCQIRRDENRQYVAAPACRNVSVEVPQWATQAAAMRGSQ
ncbi:MAG: trypsin-like serine peptidase [Leptolyngbya sp. IPPAS B-1204]|nr:MAG: hypothetical protein EDM05_27005 [Leptolyngbya sp. IPPAS B-1204]